MKKPNGTKPGTNPDTDQQHLTTSAQYLRERASACRNAGGTSACRKLDAVAELLEPAREEAASEPNAAAKGRGKAGKGSHRSGPPAATATVAEPAAKPKRPDLDDEVEAGDEDDLDDDGEE